MREGRRNEIQELTFDYSVGMQISLRLLLLSVMPGFAVVLTTWMLTGRVYIRYAQRDLFLLFRVVLCIVVALSWIWITRELISWGRGNAAIQRAFLAWTRRR